MRGDGVVRDGLLEQVDIKAALGADVAESLPRPLQLRGLEVRIPLLKIVALEKVCGAIPSR